MHKYRSFLFLLMLSSCAIQAEGELERLLKTLSCESCDLSGQNLRGKDLTGASLRNSRLVGTDLRDTIIDRADLTGVDLRDAKVGNTSAIGTRFRQADLRGVRLDQMSLLGADLRETNLTHLEVDFDLEFVDLVGVQLEGARFKHGVTCGPFPPKGGWGCSAIRE